MKFRKAFLHLLPLFLVSISCSTTASLDDQWQMEGFVKHNGNPILTPQGDAWEAKDVFNPAAWSDGEQIFLLYRGEDSTGIGEWNGTSRIGLATSTDGINFSREPGPVFEPVDEWELPGGAEDPRIVKIEDRFYMTYTAYDGETARQALASSPDLRNWERHGLIFPELEWTKGHYPGKN